MAVTFHKRKNKEKEEINRLKGKKVKLAMKKKTDERYQRKLEVFSHVGILKNIKTMESVQIFTHMFFLNNLSLENDAVS